MTGGADKGPGNNVVNGFELRLAQHDGERVGQALELSIDGGGCLVEVFEDRRTGVRTFQAYTEQPIPIEAVEWLLERARIEL